MTATTAQKFKKKAQKIAFDKKHRATIKFNISRYDKAFEKGLQRYLNVEKAKSTAAAIKQDVLANWDKYLLQFEEKATQNGIKVKWAKNTQEAQKIIKNILIEKQAKLVVKSKSMTTEEIDFNQTAQEVGTTSIETDLGEFIVQIAGEKPYHIVTPAMHKSKTDIAQLFHKKLNTPKDSTPEELTAHVRKIIRQKFTTADIGVTGANFLVANVGGVGLTENEGNGLMTTAFPRTHIVIAGIEKIIPRMEHLGLFFPLLAAHGTGQQMTAYNTLFTAPRKETENDGAEEMYVILLDNGRTTVFDQEDTYKALSCIRCGACLNGCPIYKTIGGYTYDSTYSGPIGSVLTPFFKGMKDYGHLSFASSLCGRCAEVCPVKIPLTDLLLSNRKKMVENERRPFVEKIGIKGFRLLTSQRIGFDIAPAKLKNIATAPFNHIGWGTYRKMPIFAKKTFSQQYKKKQKQ